MTAAALNLLWRARQARHDNRLLDARRDLVQAVAICRAAGMNRDFAFAIKRLGQIERDLRDLDAAGACYEEAAGIYRQRGDALNLAHTLRHLGDVYQDAGRTAAATASYEEALMLYRSARGARRNDVANALRSMAIHTEEAGDVERARRLWTEARDLYASLDGPLRRIFLRRQNPGVRESVEHLARLAAR